MRTIVVLSLSLALSLSGLFLTSATVHSADGLSPGLEATLADPEARAAAIEDDIRFRESIHFRAGRAYVEGLYDHPERTTGSAVNGALFTPEEEKEFNVRNTLHKDAAIIRSYYAKHPKQARKFGGMMIDHAAGGKLAVYLLKEAGTPWRDDLKRPGRIEVRTATTSEADLLALQASIDDARLAGKSSTSGVVLTELDIARNKIRVGFTASKLESLAPGKAPAAFTKAFGSKDILIAEDEGGELATAIKGGWVYGQSPGNPHCTLGLPVDKADANDPDDDFILAAAHCQKSNWQKIYHKSQLIGRVVKTAWTSSGSIDPDAALVRVEEDTGFDVAHRVVHVKDGTPYKLEIKSKTDGHTVGDQRCATGRITGTTCGPILSSSSSPTLGGRTYPNLVKVDLVRNTNDSGGPVYWQSGSNHFVKGAGITTGKNDGGWAWYTKIGRIEWRQSDWQISLKTNPNTTGCRIPGHGGPSPDCPTDHSGTY